jgi:hypothetical protein
MKVKYIDEDDNIHLFDSEDEMLNYINNLYVNFSILPKTKKDEYKLLESGGTYFIKFRKLSTGKLRFMVATRDFNNLI